MPPAEGCLRCRRRLHATCAYLLQGLWKQKRGDLQVQQIRRQRQQQEQQQQEKAQDKEEQRLLQKSPQAAKGLSMATSGRRLSALGAGGGELAAARTPMSDVSRCLCVCVCVWRPVQRVSGCSMHVVPHVPHVRLDSTS